MNILIIGSGGREHALAWKLNQSPKVKQIYVAPGNGGTESIAKNIPLKTTPEILDWIKENQKNENSPERIDFVLVGPDDFLADGIVDELNLLNIPAFGPTKAAAQLEWSKVFAKELMKEEGIPTAECEIFTDIEKAREYIHKQIAEKKENAFPIVLKANGLALGKGVIIAENQEDAEKALQEMMGDKIFGDAGNEIVIEEYLKGYEISTHAFCDGESYVMFPSSKDHKTIFEDNKGPNTGGMGVIAPLPKVTEEQMNQIAKQIIEPTLNAMKKRGAPYKGLLYPGIMLTDTSPKVIEFNARFGDPETQPYMRLLESDLLDILIACTNGTLKEQKITWSSKSSACIVAASGGYPGKYEKGKKINGLENFNNENADDVVVFHAGTKSDAGKIVTNGGRVLNVTSLGDNLEDALAKAYTALESISFEGMQFRRDIGRY